MSSLIASLPLVPTAAQIRSEQLYLPTHIQQIGQRIATYDPDIQALMPETDRQERLLSEATALQQRFPDPATRPPLYGILFAIKDLFHVDGFATRAGLKLPPELFAGPQASCITKLREAGALPLAKTMTTEAAYFEPAPTGNPHNLAHTPGGSSSGSAAAVAAGFCSLALGTQTIGSVIRPAAFCGIVGFKPTYGRVPTDGLFPCAPSLDTIGFFTSDIAGVEPVAELLCTQWQTATSSGLPVLGVPDGPYLHQASAEALAAFEKQIASLEEAGYTVRRVQALSNIEEINYRHRRLVFAEMAQSHAAWFATYQSLYRPRTVQAILEGQTVGSDELDTAHAGRTKLRAEIEALMAREQIDLWISPAAPGPAPEGIASTGNPAMNLPWTHAGLPALALPAGYASNGLPLGLQIVGTYMGDERLVAWAKQIATALS